MESDEQLTIEPVQERKGGLTVFIDIITIQSTTIGMREILRRNETF